MTSDWEGLVDERPRHTFEMGAVLGRFVIGRVLGHGGMGIVYEAKHRDTGAEVALKTLHHLDSTTSTRLTSEFRHLAQVRHPRLVQLYELHTIGDHCFITMEKIDGVSLDVWLRNQDSIGPDDYNRLRRCFRQVAEGLLAIHTRDLLHLDLKPDNVLVDRQGQVHIVDFGLAAPLTGSHGSRGSQEKTSTAGTPRYMAPERFRGDGQSTKTDWFAFGVMLADALCPGHKGPPAAIEFESRVPADLKRLCRSLLEPNPAARPDGQAVSRVLGAQISGTYPAVGAHTTRRLVGREEETTELQCALDEAQMGRATWVRLSGESGVGKSALVRQFRQDIASRSDVLVLSGTCHERESTPFQGLDEVMVDIAGEFSPRLDTLSGRERRQLLAAEAVSTAFSDLCVDTPDGTLRSARNPFERRREAFEAIKGLIEGLCKKRAVVLILDDVQWGDSGGARLLSEVLVTPTPRHLLVVTICSTKRDAPPTFLEELRGVLSMRGTSIVGKDLQLGPLSDQHVRDCLPGPARPLSASRQQAIVQASGGLPFLAEALGGHPWKEDESPSLSKVIAHRLDEAPLGSAEALRAVCLSPSPLPQTVALESVVDAARRSEVLAALRNAKLVRTAGSTPDSPLEPYHGLVARTVSEKLSSAEEQDVRLRLASSLEQKSLATAEQLANLYHLAGARRHAARWAPRAAREAERSLAFESAAHWYGQAAAWDPVRSREMLPRRARCLEYAGRSAEAAATYEQCAKLPEAPREKLVRAAGSAWLSAGHIERGMDVLGPELAAMDAPISRSEKRALLSSFYLIWKLNRRGTDFSPTSEEQCDPGELGRLGAIWNASKGLSAPMPFRALSLQLRCLQASLQLGEPRRIARSLAAVGPLLVGTPWEETGEKWTQKAQELNFQIGSQYLKGMLLTFDAFRMAAKWEDPEGVLRKATAGFEIFDNLPGALAWERNTAYATGLRVRKQLGLFEELERLGADWLAKSTDRGDLFAQAIACQARATAKLANGRISQARSFARRSVEHWSLSTFTAEHFYALQQDLQCDLVEELDLDALQKLREAWPQVESAQLLRHPISRPEILLLRGLVELAAARQTQQKRCPEAQQVAARLAKDKNRVARAHGQVIAYACRCLSGSTTDALDELQQASAAYGVHGQFLQRACLQLMMAERTRDPTRRERALAELRSMGVAAPERYARAHVPLIDV